MNLHDKLLIKTVLDWWIINSVAFTSCRTKWPNHLGYATDTSALKKITYINKRWTPSLNASGSIVSIGLSDNILEQKQDAFKKGN